MNLQPTRLGAQALGGLTFGAGFALIAYCPGTGAEGARPANKSRSRGSWQSIGMPLGKTSAENAEKGELEKLHAAGVVFAGCEKTLSRMKIDNKELVEFSTAVDSGVAEVIRKTNRRLRLHQERRLSRALPGSCSPAAALRASCWRRSALAPRLKTNREC